MQIHQADFQIAAARHLGWLPASVTIEDDAVCMEGWALSVWDPADRRRFLVNGVDCETLEWPLPSPDLLGPFGLVPGAAAARFRARHRFASRDALFPDGFVRMNVTGPYGEHRLSYRTAWFMADPEQEPPLPSQAQVARVIGAPDLGAFRHGGATTVRRFDALLRERFGRPLASFESVLDWGCGAGRISRYLPRLAMSVTGIDIDPDNIAGCRASLADAEFLCVDRAPPTALPAGAFDLVVGLSVMTHLDEPAQDAWLAELHRLTRPHALLLLSIQGAAQMALYAPPAEMKLQTHRKGIHDAGANDQLADVIADPDYYRNVLHSHDYVLSHWARSFEVLDIIEGLAACQDVVILRRRAD